MEFCFYKSIFEEGGNRSARRKPSKSGSDRLKLNPYTTFEVEVEGVIDVRYASLTSQGVQHRVLYLDGHPSRYQPREQTGTGVFPLVIAVPRINAFWFFRQKKGGEGLRHTRDHLTEGVWNKIIQDTASNNSALVTIEATRHRDKFKKEGENSDARLLTSLYRSPLRQMFATNEWWETSNINNDYKMID